MNRISKTSLILVALLSFLVVFTSSAAAKTTLVGAPPVFQGYVNNSLAPTPNVSVDFFLALCPGSDSSACAYNAINNNGKYAIYLNPQLTADKMWTTLHEVGHIFDYVVMTETSRNLFIKILHETHPWRSGANSPNEKFAEAYALCSLKKKIKKPVIEGYDLHLTPKQFTQTCKMIRLRAMGFYP